MAAATASATMTAPGQTSARGPSARFAARPVPDAGGAGAFPKWSSTAMTRSIRIGGSSSSPLPPSLSEQRLPAGTVMVRLSPADSSSSVKTPPPPSGASQSRLRR